MKAILSLLIMATFIFLLECEDLTFEKMQHEICQLVFPKKSVYMNCLCQVMDVNDWVKILEIAECLGYFSQFDFLLGYVCNHVNTTIVGFPVEKQRCMKNFRSYSVSKSIFNKRCYTETMLIG
ncbi:uncharacterized protein LOC111620820 [Centruroides sculpturatus]|uniref:uncharacterized protein LOC111620820 n=1 Tax=Centruroides sculpturatus TaxID=218467 RepID=UPI000C6D2CBC|nr:uncharacterized protein LOC111620820 [Centruroides sculpturatus]